MAHQKKPNRQKPRTEHWVHVCSGMDGSEKMLMCFGVNLHDYKWQHTGRTAKVKNPHYDAYHNFPVYAVDINGKNVNLHTVNTVCVSSGFLPAVKTSQT